MRTRNVFNVKRLLCNPIFISYLMLYAVYFVLLNTVHILFDYVTYNSSSPLIYKISL